MDSDSSNKLNVKEEHSEMNFEQIFIQERVTSESIKTEIPDYEDVSLNAEGHHEKQDFDFNDRKIDEDFTKEEPHWSSQGGPELADFKPTKTFSVQRFVEMDINHSVISFYSTQDAIDYAKENPLTNDVDHVDIIEIPPQVDNPTDEEDFDEDISNDENWNCPQVPGTVELHYFDDEESNSDFEHPLNKKQKVCEVSWKESHPSYSTFSATSNRANKRKEVMKTILREKSPVELFELFFSEELLELICTQSIIYASQKNNHNFVLTPNCLKKFFGILFFTSYHRLPDERQYWSLDEDFDISIIREVMTRDRFIEIKKYLHFVNNQEIPTWQEDSSFKIKPVINILNKNFKQFGIFSKEISIDKQIVRYYGKNSLRQFNKDKPIRFGFKQWMMCCGTTGYCYHMELYQGKAKRPFMQQACDSEGSKVIFNMIQHLQNPEDHEIYVSSFLTSYKMLVHMKSLGIKVTGATHPNLTNKCPLRSDKEMKIEGYGAYDYRFDKNEEILFVKWNTTSLVTVGTNHQKVNPLGTAKRWSGPNQKDITVPQPQVITQYTKFITGVDHLDWLIQEYHIGVRSKKWYFTLFTNYLDIAVINAWVLHSAISGEALSLLDFKRRIARAYLQLHSVSDPKDPRQPKKNYSGVVLDARFPSAEHTIYRTEGGKPRKCAVCTRKVSKQCVKCDVGLHMGECYNKWHSK